MLEGKQFIAAPLSVINKFLELSNLNSTAVPPAEGLTVLCDRIRNTLFTVKFQDRSFLSLTMPVSHVTIWNLRTAWVFCDTGLGENLTY